MPEDSILSRTLRCFLRRRVAMTCIASLASFSVFATVWRLNQPPIFNNRTPGVGDVAFGSKKLRKASAKVGASLSVYMCTPPPLKKHRRVKRKCGERRRKLTFLGSGDASMGCTSCPKPFQIVGFRNMRHICSAPTQATLVHSISVPTAACCARHTVG